MTDQLRQAAQQALDALAGELLKMLDKPEDEQYRVKYAYLLTVITALREAMAQQAEPVCPECKAAVLYECIGCSSNNYPQQQAEPPPPEWPLIKNILAEYGLDAISFVAEWKAAQRPWQGLTEADWEWVADKKETSLDTFAHGAAWAADILKGCNK